MKKIVILITALLLVCSFTGCKTRGETSDTDDVSDNSVSDNSDESSSLIKTGKKEIGKIDDSASEKALSKDVECEINTPDNIKLSQINFELQGKDKPITLDLNKTDLKTLQKTLGLKDRGLKNKVSRSKGFLFDGKGYIRNNEGTVTFIETENNKIKAICFSTEYSADKFSVDMDESEKKTNDIYARICGGIGLWSKEEDVRKNIGSGVRMYGISEDTSVVYYKNSSTTLVITYEKISDTMVVTEMTIINNAV